MKIALTIAGADPTGGAGVPMDLKVFHHFNCYGVSVTTAVTVQNTLGVHGYSAVPVEIVVEQLDRLLATVKPAAIKTGMLATAEILAAVNENLKHYPFRNLVVDPVLVAKNSFPLLEAGAWELLKSTLIPRATVITPNLFEASILSGISITNLDAMREAALSIHRFGAKNVLIKGGHLKGTPVDLLFDGKRFIEFSSPRIKFKNVHGTGCAFSAALAAGLANGLPVKNSVARAKNFVRQGIANSIKLGRGQRLLSLHKQI
jgi:hydroxymethylpyrimidine kinase/phosphomethylpyrimidine kinase